MALETVLLRPGAVLGSGSGSVGMANPDGEVGVGVVSSGGIGLGSIGMPEVGPGVEICSGCEAGDEGYGGAGLDGIDKTNINSSQQSEILRNIGRGL